MRVCVYTSIHWMTQRSSTFIASITSTSICGHTAAAFGTAEVRHFGCVDVLCITAAHKVLRHQPEVWGGRAGERARKHEED